MISIIIPAHNESSCIARTLHAITRDCADNELEVIVVCNGCTDETANIARSLGSPVHVIETEIASKSAALNLGDQIARAFPQIYIDADIVITTDAIRALVRRLEQGDVLGVAPTPNINLVKCSSLVRAYYSIRARLPSSREGIGGSGVYALSKAGRARFSDFPKIVADDTYVRLQFKPQERQTLTTITSTVYAPHTAKQLIGVRTRAYYGTFEVARYFPELLKNMGESNHRDLIALQRNPKLWFASLVYFCINSVARCRAEIWYRLGIFVWQRDNTSRAAAGSLFESSAGEHHDA